MGIYDDKPTLNVPRLPISRTRLLQLIAAIVIIVAVTGLVWWAGELLKPKPLTLSFERNPLVTDGSAEELVKLTVVVRNTTQQDAFNVSVTAEAVAKEVLLVGTDYYQSKVLATVEAGGARELEYFIRPRPNRNLLPGDYVIKVAAEFNGERYQESAILHVKAPN